MFWGRRRCTTPSVRLSGWSSCPYSKWLPNVTTQSKWWSLLFHITPRTLKSNLVVFARAQWVRILSFVLHSQEGCVQGQDQFLWEACGWLPEEWCHVRADQHQPACYCFWWRLLICLHWSCCALCMCCQYFLVLCGNSFAYGQDFFYIGYSVCCCLSAELCMQLAFWSFCLYCFTYASLTFHATPQLCYCVYPVNSIGLQCTAVHVPNVTYTTCMHKQQELVEH